MIWCSRIQPLLRGPWVYVVGLPEMVREPQAQLGAIPHDRWSGGMVVLPSTVGNLLICDGDIPISGHYVIGRTWHLIQIEVVSGRH